jgi:RNA polymerase sigma-70 factor, ECF subfamily
MELDDAALERVVERAKNGDAEAFGELFDRFHVPVYRYIASRVARPSDAEDLTQTVFVKALEALPRYEPRGVPFGGWLFRLARNTVIDFARTRRDHVGFEALLERPADDGAPDALAALRQDIAEVRTALARLTEEQRETISLRFFAGLSAREAAIAMGKQEGTIRGLQFRAIATLRRHLQAGDPDAAVALTAISEL